jgi:hypothetical protein
MEIFIIYFGFQSSFIIIAEKIFPSSLQCIKAPPLLRERALYCRNGKACIPRGSALKTKAGVPE